MMKMKTIYYLLLFVLGCGLMSCYDDKSTYDTKEIPNVELDLNGNAIRGVFGQVAY